MLIVYSLIKLTIILKIIKNPNTIKSEYKVLDDKAFIIPDIPTKKNRSYHFCLNFFKKKIILLSLSSYIISLLFLMSFINKINHIKIKEANKIIFTIVFVCIVMLFS